MQTRITNIRLAHLVTGPLLALMLIRLYFLLPFPVKPDQIDWTPYSLAGVHQDLEQGKLVLISAKASWCITTQAGPQSTHQLLQY